MSDDAPTETWNDGLGVQGSRWFDKDGRVHRSGAPASISLHRTGVVVYEGWVQHGQGHREGGEPAIVRRDPDDGCVVFEAWRKHGLCARENGLPTVVVRDTRAPHNVVEERWHVDGRLQREGGFPASVSYDRNTGEITNEEWWEGDMQISPQTPVKRAVTK